jgi:primary-amine oxidase
MEDLTMGISVRAVTHPLDPLSPREIAAAAELLRKRGILGENCRVHGVELVEPDDKEAVFAFDGGPVRRRLRFVVLDRASGRAEEVVVGQDHEELVERVPIPRGQPAITLEEFDQAEVLCKADPRYAQALAQRGIDDPSLVIVDLYGIGAYGDIGLDGRRLARGLSWVRPDPGGNPYAHPVDNLHVIVDLNRMEIVEIEDWGVLPVPHEPGPYELGSYEIRGGLRPLEIVQDEGPSFTLEGYVLSWQKWRMRLGFTQREGLVLHTVTYHDQGRDRPVLYRASLSEQVTPYGDTRASQWRKNAFDEGEYNMGSLANSLTLGCDCLGEIRYLDAVWADPRGEPVVLNNAICVHEEDHGILWRHYDFRRDQSEVRRSRRLVVSSVYTIANYDYAFYWYFYQDGGIELEIKITGIMSTAATGPGSQPEHGQLLNPDGLYGPIHQHIFNIRLDMMVDGLTNTVYEVDTTADPEGPENPHHNGYRQVAVPLRSELEGRRVVNSSAGRYWTIVNRGRMNRLGQPVAYNLVPGPNLLPFAGPASSIRQRAGFTDCNLWVTRYHPRERYAAGDYPNQHPGGDGLPAYAAADRSIENTDLVLWYTLQNLHAARVEDWPIIQLATIGFRLQPNGFFDRNPAMDVPPPPGRCHQSA